jgi:uncharacterized membrane protein
MTVLFFSLVVGTASVIAGFLGAITGLGGGVVIVPLLALALGVDIRYAIGASLVSVIATSSGAAAPSGRGLIQLGLLFLIATPVARVAFSVAAFALEKDTLYVAVTLVVLTLLLLSLTGHTP